MTMGDEMSGITLFGKEVASLHDLAHRLLSAYVEANGIKLTHLDTEGRRQVIRSLHALGYFDLRDSVDVFSDMSGVSRVTIYADIKNIKVHNIS